MPVTIPNIDICLRKIKKDCTVNSHKLAAIAFLKSGQTLAVDTNRAIYNREAFSHFKWSIHAEEFLVRKLARIKAKERFNDLYVLVARWGARDGWAMAKPCMDCERILDKYGITQVFFTNHSGDIDVLW